MPVVLIFSELVVCMDCGTAQVAVPEAELQPCKRKGSRGIDAELLQQAYLSHRGAGELPPRPWRARAEVKRIDFTFNSYS